MQRMLEAVRKAALPAIWSQGVKLVREDAVRRDSATSSEAILRVRAPGHVVAPTVTLYVDGDEWSCDCGGKVDPCAHVAAAAIFAAQAPPPGPPASASAVTPAGGKTPARGDSDARAAAADEPRRE